MSPKRQSPDRSRLFPALNDMGSPPQDVMPESGKGQKASRRKVELGPTTLTPERQAELLTAVVGAMKSQDHPTLCRALATAAGELPRKTLWLWAGRLESLLKGDL